MLKNITLGQFLPGNSVLHRLDPRYKLVFTFMLIAIVFTASNVYSYIFLTAFLIFLVFISEIQFKLLIRSIKPLIYIIIFTSVINVLYIPGNILWKFGFITITEEGIYTAVFMSLRLIYIIIATSFLTYTTSPILLTDGLERIMGPLKYIKVPVHELSMMMTIALRFIPTLIDETDKIISAQKARGADFESGNIIKRSMALVPILVPLIVSAFRRADELALAMECRCYRGGEGRTRMRQLKTTPLDIIASFAIILLLAAIIALNFIPTRISL